MMIMTEPFSFNDQLKFLHEVQIQGLFLFSRYFENINKLTNMYMIKRPLNLSIKRSTYFSLVVGQRYQNE